MGLVGSSAMDAWGGGSGLVVKSLREVPLQQAGARHGRSGGCAHNDVLNSLKRINGNAQRNQLQQGLVKLDVCIRA